MHGSRHALPALLGLLISILAPPAAGAAAIDPERNLAQPVPSLWTSDRTEAEINGLAGKGWRLTDVTVERQSPPRFGGTFVYNSGPYARNWYWWFGKSSTEVDALTRSIGRRLIDVEPYTVDGQRRFAIVSVVNEGEAAKEWGWNHDLTVPQVMAEADLYDLRVVDLDAYTVNGQRLYSYVGIKNQGVDARGWWLYDNVSERFVSQKLAEHGARLVDMELLWERPPDPNRTKALGSGRAVSAVMVHNPEGTFTMPFVKAPLSWIEERRASNGVRVADLDRNGDGWTGVLIDNIDGENARMRSVVRSTPFGNSYFGVFAKRVGGPTDVGLAHEDGHQPMSTVKLIPLLYAMELADRGEVNLDTKTISWRTPYGSPEMVLCERPSRLGKGELHSHSLRETLQRSLWESLNPAHEALLNTFGRQAILARMEQLGMPSLRIYPRCAPKKTGGLDWWSNGATLTEMARVYELVDLKQVFPNNWLAARNTFYDIVATVSQEPFRRVVTEEAIKLGKSEAVASEFMNLIQLEGKGGSYTRWGSGPNTIGRSFAYRVTFPIKVPVTVDPSGIAPDAHVGGFFVNRLYVPCYEAQETKPDGRTAACLKREGEVDQAFWTVTTELQRTAIHQALETW
jgi:hypothetical protein